MYVIHQIKSLLPTHICLLPETQNTPQIPPSTWPPLTLPLRNGKQLTNYQKMSPLYPEELTATPPYPQSPPKNCAAIALNPNHWFNTRGDTSRILTPEPGADHQNGITTLETEYLTHPTLELNQNMNLNDCIWEESFDPKIHSPSTTRNLSNIWLLPNQTSALGLEYHELKPLRNLLPWNLTWDYKQLTHTDLNHSSPRSSHGG